jgi:p-aminobenzoyl-glutamate transporter AbgT
MSDQAQPANGNGGFLATVERIGNKLPDPAVLFIALLFIVWVLSWLLSYVTFDVIDPRSGQALTIQNLLTGSSFTEFLSDTDGDPRRHRLARGR